MTDSTKTSTGTPPPVTRREYAAPASDPAGLGELSGVLAHELRNPLSSIKGAAQILMQEWGHLNPQGEFLSIILDEVDTLTALTTEFLDFARPLHLELMWGSWKEVVGRAVQAVRSYADAGGVTLNLTTDDDIPCAHLDHFQAERAALSLILNAVEATPRGGAVWIHASHAAGCVAMSVRDSGSGIPADGIARAFVPFFTTKLSGTGLGLPMARKIAQHHGGDVVAVPNQGPGMTFTIHLPASGES